jgi:hypothetical protein
MGLDPPPEFYAKDYVRQVVASFLGGFEVRPKGAEAITRIVLHGRGTSTVELASPELVMLLLDAQEAKRLKFAGIVMAPHIGRLDPPAYLGGKHPPEAELDPNQAAKIAALLRSAEPECCFYAHLVRENGSSAKVAALLRFQLLRLFPAVKLEFLGDHAVGRLQGREAVDAGFSKCEENPRLLRIQEGLSIFLCRHQAFVPFVDHLVVQQNKFQAVLTVTNLPDPGEDETRCMELRQSLGMLLGGGGTNGAAVVADGERNGGVRVQKINVVWMPNQRPLLHMASESDADALFEAAKASPERCTFRGATFGLERHRRYVPQRKKLQEKPAAGQLNVPPQVGESGKEKGGGAETGLVEIKQKQGEANKEISQEKEGVAVKGDSEKKGQGREADREASVKEEQGGEEVEEIRNQAQKTVRETPEKRIQGVEPVKEAPEKKERGGGAFKETLEDKTLGREAAKTGTEEKETGGEAVETATEKKDRTKETEVDIASGRKGQMKGEPSGTGLTKTEAREGKEEEGGPKGGGAKKAKSGGNVTSPERTAAESSARRPSVVSSRGTSEKERGGARSRSERGRGVSRRSRSRSRRRSSEGSDSGESTDASESEPRRSDGPSKRLFPSPRDPFGRPWDAFELEKAFHRAVGLIPREHRPTIQVRTRKQEPSYVEFPSARDANLFFAEWAGGRLPIRYRDAPVQILPPECFSDGPCPPGIPPPGPVFLGPRPFPRGPFPDPCRGAPFPPGRPPFPMDAPPRGPVFGEFAPFRAPPGPWDGGVRPGWGPGPRGPDFGMHMRGPPGWIGGPGFGGLRPGGPGFGGFGPAGPFPGGFEEEGR